jgi:hypothetical protein
MLYFALAYSAILIVCSFASACCTWTKYRVACFVILGMGILPLYCIFAIPFNLLNTTLILGVALLCHWRKASPFTYLAGATLASVLALVTFLTYERSGWGEIGQARKLYPPGSLEERLKYEQQQTLSVPNDRTAFSEDRLTKVEDRIQAEWMGHLGYERENSLRLMHENTVEHFVNSPGFGVGRGVPSLRKVVLPDMEAIPLPSPQDDYFDRKQKGEIPSTSPGKPAEIKGDSPWWELHQESVADFVNPVGFGYMKDRQRVTGFQAHYFKRTPKLPADESSWRVRELHLMSLLKHERPRVYVSRNLPRMDELADAPTRALDSFEHQGLEILRKGEDLAIASSPDRIRVLGSLRATTQCLNCHHAERGDLLGAFTYIFDRESTAP